MQASKYVPLYFAPDLDPSWSTNPGILTDVSNMVPTKRGTYINYACSTTIGPTFSEATYGFPITGAILKKVDGTARLFVATPTRVLEATDTSTFVDRSKSGADYTTNSDHWYNTDWDFTTYGNDVIAVSKKNPVQYIDASASTFIDLPGGPPKAACCTTNKNFVLLGNCNNGVNDLGDQVWWSALGNDQSWTADAATQAGNYRLLDTPGNVTALVNLRDAVIAYKEDSVYVGDYQGSPELWTWRLVSDRVGCGSAHGVAIIDGIHYFCHRTGIFRFDGASIQPLGQTINSYLFSKVVNQTKYATFHAAYDEYTGLILWFFNDPGAATGFVRRRAVAYHPFSGKFGFVYDTWDANTCRGVIKASLADIAAWASSQATLNNSMLTIGSVSGTATILRPIFGGASSTAKYLQTGDIGDEINVTKLTGIKPRMLSYSGSMADITVYGRMYEGQANDAGVTFTADAAKQRWQGTHAARSFNTSLSLSSYGEIAGIYLTATPSGSE